MGLFLTASQLLMAQATVGIRAGVMSSKQEVQEGDITEEYASKLGADIAFVTYFR